MHENKQFQKPLDSVFPTTSEADITASQNSTHGCNSLFVLIFIFVDNRREEKRFWTDLYQAFQEVSLLSIYSCLQF